MTTTNMLCELVLPVACLFALAIWGMIRREIAANTDSMVKGVDSRFSELQEIYSRLWKEFFTTEKYIHSLAWRRLKTQTIDASPEKISLKLERVTANYRNGGKFTKLEKVELAGIEKRLNSFLTSMKEVETCLRDAHTKSEDLFLRLPAVIKEHQKVLTSPEAIKEIALAWATYEYILKNEGDVTMDVYTKYHYIVQAHELIEKALAIQAKMDSTKPNM